MFSFKGRGIGPFTVHRINKHFAMTEECLNPSIYVFNYPNFENVVILEGVHIIIQFVDKCIIQGFLHYEHFIQKTYFCFEFLCLQTILMNVFSSFIMHFAMSDIPCSSI